jgi:hypothetical protein
VVAVSFEDTVLRVFQLRGVDEAAVRVVLN